MQKETLGNLETLGPVGIKVRSNLEMLFDKLNNKSDSNKKPAIVSMIKNAEIDYNVAIQLSHLMIATGVNDGQNLTQLAISIGDRVRNFYKLPKKSELSLKFGIFILNAYAIIDMVVIKLVNDYHSFNKAKTVYKVYAGKNRNDLRKLVKEFNEVSDPYKPLLDQAPNWEYGTVKISNGEEIKMIKNAGVNTLSQINPNNTPIVINALNKKQAIAYTVTNEIFELYKWSLKTNQPCFEHNSVDTIELARKEAKKREAKQILDAATPYVGKKFYQQYTTDNRGRIYPLSAYLNELNSDNAKGMLTFYEGKPLGSSGLNQLYHHIANMFGEDKLPHVDKVKYVENMYNEFVNYGNDPYTNKGWMEAEEPFQFISAAMELAKYDTFVKQGNNPEDFISYTICYRDGSNNGLQWLFSLAKDDKHAHLVNVKPTLDNKPGDMYSHVAVRVKDTMHEEAQKVNEIALKYYDIYFKGIEKLRNRCRIAELNNDPKADNKRKVVKWYQRRYKEQLKLTDIIYWDKATFTHKEWRKICKRNVMTYGYSATKQGMGEQIIQDTRDIDNVYLSNKQHSAARQLGSLVYTTIESEFPMVSDTMKLFKDNCGQYMMQTGKQYSHTTLLTNFPFTQKYVKYKKVRVKITDGLLIEKQDKTLDWDYHLFLDIKSELALPNINKAKAGISPNTIHNLDSAHLMLVVDKCDFDIVSAHDSYGSHACNVETMQKVIREKFKLLIDNKPLEDILDQTGNLVQMIKTGQLDSADILKSEFAFA